MPYYGETPYASGGYTYVEFLQSGQFVTPEGVTVVDLLVVAGGGGGAYPSDRTGGGGGAGGCRYVTGQAVTGTYTVTVGSGGTGGISGTPATSGGASSFGALVTTVGGGRGGTSGANKATGGSGGGGPHNDTGGAAGTSGEGSAGARGSDPGQPGPFSGGGGGGKDGAGTAGGSSGGGAGGAGHNYSTFGTGYSVAGGGGGGCDPGDTTGKTGGSATNGGGAGGCDTNGAGTAGTTNRGGGGGGGGSHQNASQGNGGAGGSGIIVIRYLLASEGTGTATTGAVQATGSGGTSVHQTILTDGLYTVYVFDSPGTVNVDFPDGIQEEDTAEILVVGGGGGTGSATSGGGGAGGYIAETGISISDGMTAVIGEGGLAGSGDVGLAGGNSSFAGYTAYGGGYGAAGNNGGGAGGSGGGGGATLMEGSFPTGGSGTSGQGHNGGTGSHSNTGGQYLTPGGGGGAAAVGEGGTGIDGGAGGAGTANDITGTSVTYAAGGHGAGTSGAGSNGTDGRGNGGNGGYTSSGRGGCGCVIIRFLTPMNEGLLTLGSPTATGTGDVHAEYGATGQLNVTGPRVSGVGRHPNVGTGRAELGKVSVLGEAAPFAFLYADGSLTLNVTALLVESMAAAVSVTVAGDEDYGWLHDDIVDASLSAACVLRVAPNLAMMNRSSLPPTDELGLTAAERATPDLRGLRVYLGGKAIQRALIRDLTIVLSDRGGYESATLVLDRSVRKKQYANFSTLRVVYKTVVLFRGRLDGRGPALSDEMVHSLSFTGPIVQLKDHKGFRRVYADSDLSSWQTGQGPNTSANVFDIEAT